MNKKLLRKDIVFFNLLILFILAVVAVVLIYYRDSTVLLSFSLLAAVSFTIILTYDLGLQKGLIISLVFVFIYGSYIIYNVLVTQTISEVDFSHIIWLFIIPVGSLLTGELSLVITKYNWDLETMKTLEKLVTIDGSTGFYNHQGFFKKIDEEFLRSKRYNNKFAILLLKIDNFKEIRMIYGETDAGKILKAVADVMDTKIRYSDVRAVLDNNVLGVLLTETNEDGAKIVVEKLHQVLNVVTVIISGSRKVINVKPRIGVAAIREADNDVLEIYERAKVEIDYDKG